MIDGSEKHNCQLAFELQNSHVCENAVMMSYYQDLGSASDWSCCRRNLLQPISTAQIWTVMNYYAVQYAISVIVTQMSFCGETSGIIMNFWLFFSG